MHPISQHKIRVICPCYNEVEGISHFLSTLQGVLAKIKTYQFKILFVDDGSTDGTLDTLKKLSQKDKNVEVLSFSRNFGHQTALLAGIETTTNDYAAIIMLDSDLQHPPELISTMIAKWEEGYEVVSMIRKTTSASWSFKSLSSRLYYKAINLLSDVKIIPNCADFALISRSAFLSLQAMKERDLFLRGAISWIGSTRTFIEYDQAERTYGTTKYTLRKMLRLASLSVFSFSSQPIALCFNLGFFLSSLAFLYFSYAVLMFFFNGTVKGWTSIIAVVVFFGGVNLLMLGLVGGYISRIFEEVKNRPRYLLKWSSIQSASEHGDITRSNLNRVSGDF